MRSGTPPSVLIVGAGALGSACSHALAHAGWRVTLIDDGRPSASAAAAGMLAPAFEAALDEVEPGTAELFRAARDRWPTIAARCGLEIVRDGAAWRAHDGCSESMGRRLAGRLRACGFRVEGASSEPFTPDDWRLDPVDGLRRLRQGAELKTGHAARAGAGRSGAWVELSDGVRLEGDHLVIATGAGPSPFDPVRTVTEAVRPIKGQIVSAQAPPPPHVLRTTGAYVVPRAGGVLVGATMEAGRTDSRVEPEVTARLLEAAARIWPPLGQAAGVEAAAAVRGASPDGLPLAGSAGPRVSVALAPRRNGWLMAPLVAEIVAAYCCGADPGPYAAALDPLRFAQQAA